MSGYGGSGRGNRDERYGRQRSRSRSPELESNRPAPRDRGYQMDRGGNYHHDSRGGGRDRGRGRGRGRGGCRGGFGGGSQGGTTSFKSNNPDLPDMPPFPTGTGAKIPYPNLPPRGSAGTKAVFKTNHFPLLTLPIIKVFQYNVYFKIPASSQLRGGEKATAKQIARLFVNEVAAQILGDHFMFDGVSLGWSIDDLGEQKDTMLSLGARKNGKPNDIQFGIKRIGTLDITSLVNFIQRAGGGELNPTGSETVQDTLKFISTVYRDDVQRRFIHRPNNNTFFRSPIPFETAVLGSSGVLSACKGLFQSMIYRFGRLTLNLDIATSPFWTPDQSLLDNICKLLRVSPRDLQTKFQESPDRFFQAAAKLLGVYFEVRHLAEPKKFKFQSWSKADALSSSFEEQVDDNTLRPTTVASYFLNKYRIELRYPKLPMASTRAGLFPLELCFTPHGERYKGVLEGEEVAGMLKIAAVKGDVRQKQVLEIAKELQWHNLERPRAFGLSCATKMLEVEGKTLPAPRISYGNGTVKPDGPIWKGLWNLRGRQFTKSSTIKSWAMVGVSEGRAIDERTLRDLGHDIWKGFRTVGMGVPRDPPEVHIPNYGQGMLQVVAEASIKAQRAFGSPPDCIFFILQAPSTEVYRVIKQAMDARTGIISQVIILPKATKGGMQYIANVAMKVNAKLKDGVNHEVIEPLFKQSRWMLVGADTSFASPGALRQIPPPPATAALTATYDKACLRYTSVASVQESTTQAILNSNAMISALLGRYKEKNNGLMPQNIIYFRDGVSESEVASIIQEAKPLKLQCPEAKITVILAIKRHHTRLFGLDGGSIPPGSVVDNLTQNVNFFLVAHPQLQGTQCPTHYITILDENKLGHEVTPRIVNGLCSNYARATRSVSLVTPIYYAHQVCERARLMLADKDDGTQELLDVHENLKWSQYWL